MTNILIVTGRFYREISNEMLEGALEAINAHDDVAYDHIEKITHDHISVPGTFEIPAAIAMGIESGKYDGYIALGCVIRGETSHYDYVCMESARGLNELAIKYIAPIGYGILTCESKDQARTRANRNEGNKGAVAAYACLEMIVHKKRFQRNKITQDNGQ